MPANLIEYEVVRVGPEVAEIKRGLADLGRKGYELAHTHVDEKGVYTFIFSKDTGLTAESDNNNQVGGDWIDDGFVNEETAWT